MRPQTHTSDDIREDVRVRVRVMVRVRVRVRVRSTRGDISEHARVRTPHIVVVKTHLIMSTVYTWTTSMHTMNGVTHTHTHTHTHSALTHTHSALTHTHSALTHTHRGCSLPCRPILFPVRTVYLYRHCKTSAKRQKQPPWSDLHTHHIQYITHTHTYTHTLSHTHTHSQTHTHTHTHTLPIVWENTTSDSNVTWYTVFTSKLCLGVQ